MIQTPVQPLDPHVQFSMDQCLTTIEEKAAMNAVPYREAIGVLNWVAVGTWPDIVFAIGQLAQFMKNPGCVHWEAVKWVLQYLKGTWDWRLVYGGGEACGLEGFVDTDGAMQEHRWVISGYVILIDGGAVSWCSNKNLLPCWLPSLNMLPLCMPPRNLFGSNDFLKKSFGHSDTQTPSTQTISLWLLLLIQMGNFMPEPRGGNFNKKVHYGHFRCKKAVWCQIWIFQIFVIFFDEVLVDIVTLAIYSNYPWLLLYMDVAVRGWVKDGWEEIWKVVPLHHLMHKNEAE